MPDLCEGYLAMGTFKLGMDQRTEAKFYLSQAETLIFRTDYQPLKIQLYSAQADLHLAEMHYRDAESSFEKALALARRLSNTLEEAKALGKLGRLALVRKDYRDAMGKLQQALVSFQCLGAVYDTISIYHDLVTLFLGEKDFARAKEMAVLLDRQAKLLGFTDLMEKAAGRSGKLRSANFSWRGNICSWPCCRTEHRLPSVRHRRAHKRQRRTEIPEDD